MNINALTIRPVQDRFPTKPLPAEVRPVQIEMSDQPIVSYEVEPGETDHADNDSLTFIYTENGRPSKITYTSEQFGIAQMNFQAKYTGKGERPPIEELEKLWPDRAVEFERMVRKREDEGPFGLPPKSSDLGQLDEAATSQSVTDLITRLDDARRVVNALRKEAVTGRPIAKNDLLWVAFHQNIIADIHTTLQSVSQVNGPLLTTDGSGMLQLGTFSIALKGQRVFAHESRSVLGDI